MPKKNAAFLNLPAEETQEASPIERIDKDTSPVATALNYVVNQLRFYRSWFSCHGPKAFTSFVVSRD